MPYQDYTDGLYLLKKESSKKGFEHYGILDVGNRLHHPDVDGCHPVVVHQTPPSICIEWLQDTGIWDVMGKITDEAAAIQRMLIAFSTPDYDLFGNNCEHFARFVATGNRESTQLQAAGIVTGLTALTIYAISSESDQTQRTSRRRKKR